MVAGKGAYRLFNSPMRFPSKKARWYASNKSKKVATCDFRKHTSKHILCSVLGSLTVSCSNAGSPLERSTSWGMKEPTQQPMRSSGSRVKAMCGCAILEVNSQPLTKPWMTSWFQPHDRLQARAIHLASSQVSDTGKLWDNAPFKFWVATFGRWRIIQTVLPVSAMHTSCDGRQVESSCESPFPHIRRSWPQVCEVSKTVPDRQEHLEHTGNY